MIRAIAPGGKNLNTEQENETQEEVSKEATLKETVWLVLGILIFIVFLIAMWKGLVENWDPDNIPAPITAPAK